MIEQIDLDERCIEVVRKAIRNVHLSVNPPDGQVRIAAPERMDMDALRLFAISKLAWIRREQRKMQTQEREPPREYLDRENHYVWGKRYLLEVVEYNTAPSIELQHQRLIVRLRPGTPAAQRQAIMDRWYREQIRAALPTLIEKSITIPRIGPRRVFVQRMKTRWGSCNPALGHIRLNTEPAKKPPECLEYILVHEMTHLIEPRHNPHFAMLMDHLIPQWAHLRGALNDLPLRHETW